MISQCVPNSIIPDQAKTPVWRHRNHGVRLAHGLAMRPENTVERITAETRCTREGQCYPKLEPT